MVSDDPVKKEYNPNPIGVLFRYFWHFAKGERKRTVLYLTLFVIANLINFIPPLVTAKILNIVQESGITQSNYLTIIMWLGVIIILEVLFWASHGPARVMEKAVSFRIAANYKKYLLDGTLHLPAKWHSDNHSGDTFDKIEKATKALKDFSSHMFENVQMVVRFISAYIALVYFNLNSAYIVILFCVLSIIIILRMDRRIIPRLKKLNRYQNKISAKVYDAITNITTVLILRIERPMLRMIGYRIDEPYDFDFRTNKINELKWFFTAMLFTLMIFSIIGTYVLSAVNNETTVMVGTLSILFNYTHRIGGLFFRFTFRYGNFVQWRANIANAEEISDDFTPARRRKFSSLGRRWREITVSDLQFRYDDDSHNLHLDNISFTLRRGERVAFIGASGSGKTTALKVLRELHPVNSVDLRVDGRKIKEGFSRISESITLIPQDPEIFSTTISENITLGLPIAKRKIWNYCDLAKFTPVAKRLPQGLESNINEKGVNLSGGEKQRLALARGLLACENKDIILLDEPTSSVDPKNELEIYNKIFSTFKGKTIVSSIHRLHLLPYFDHIYLFHGGRIVASGNYELLQKESKLFCRMLDKYKQREVKRRK